MAQCAWCAELCGRPPAGEGLEHGFATRLAQIATRPGLQSAFDAPLDAVGIGAKRLQVSSHDGVGEVAFATKSCAVHSVSARPLPLHRPRSCHPPHSVAAAQFCPLPLCRCC